jgi:hypothetical protein
MDEPRFFDRGLAPHPFTPMLGGHQTVERTRTSLRLVLAAHLERLGDRMRYCLCILLSVLLGCASTQHPLVAGDRLLVTFTNRDVPVVRTTVDAAGEISLPLAGKLRIAGMTLGRAARAIETQYPACWREPVKVSLSRL